MNNSMWWLTWLAPAIRPVATLVVLLLLAAAQRATAGTWPTMADLRAVSNELPGLWAILARSLAAIRAVPPRADRVSDRKNRALRPGPSGGGRRTRTRKCRSRTRRRSAAR